jgi:hypothetical protein
MVGRFMNKELVGMWKVRLRKITTPISVWGYRRKSRKNSIRIARQSITFCPIPLESIIK